MLAAAGGAAADKYSIYLLYQGTSTNTDAEARYDVAQLVWTAN
jgi:hypothetical protein